MYPSGELRRLAVQKQLVIAQSDLLRVKTAASLDALAQPVTWVESGLTLWRQWSPLIGLSSLLFTRNSPPRKLGWLNLVLKLAPSLLQTIRGFSRTGPL